MKRYEVIEDNGGGLYKFIFDEAGNIIENEWDNCGADPQEEYSQITSYEYGWKIVADNDGIYPRRMGGAARAEFAITEDIEGEDFISWNDRR